MVKWMLKVVFEENLVSEIGRACLIELWMQVKMVVTMQAYM